MSRRALVSFGLATLLMIAELVWWVTFNVIEATNRRDEAMAQLVLDRDNAESWLSTARHSGEISSDSDVQRWLKARYAGLSWQDGQVMFDEATERAIRGRHGSRLSMFLWEGGFFLAVLMFGAGVILRTLRREVGLSRQQANFLSAVTHELKSPLAAIRLYAETMQLRDSSPEKRKRYLAGIASEADRLETLVVNLLAVARLDNRAMVVHPEVTDLTADVAQLVESMREDFMARGVQITTEFPPMSVWGRVDLGVLKTVLRNLLDNAAKYGKRAEGTPGTAVTVRLLTDGPTIEVQDFGIGLAQGELERVFERFYRVGDEMVRQAEGTGLGLYLVRTLIRQCGGEVTAHSEGPGKGTTFRVRVLAAAP